MRLVLCLCLVALIFSGCETPEYREANLKWVSNYEGIVDEHIVRCYESGRNQVALDVRWKKLSIGMFEIDVMLALRLTGSADKNTLSTTQLSPGGSQGSIKVNRTVTTSGTYDQWVMPDYFDGPKYIYIDDGILTSWQS